MKILEVDKYIDDDRSIDFALSPKDREYLSTIAQIIKRTSCVRPKYEWESNIECMGVDCKAKLNTKFVDRLIHYYCPECGRRGLIKNWQGTKWNYSNLNIDEEGEMLIDKWLTNSLSKEEQKLWMERSASNRDFIGAWMIRHDVNRDPDEKIEYVDEDYDMDEIDFEAFGEEY